MASFPPERDAGSRSDELFSTTHWSVVLLAGQSASPQAAEALEQLCRTYWYPLYAFVRRQGYSTEDAQDLTQEFFARFLEKRCLGQADPACGKFRTFLLTSLKNFLANEWIKAGRQKRGGHQVQLSYDVAAAERFYAAEPVNPETPEILYEKRWAAALLEKVLGRLRADYTAADKGRLFEELKIYVWGEKSGVPYAEVAANLGMAEGAVKVAVHRLRQRYGELLRYEIAHTVVRPEDIDDELRHLIAVIST